MFYQLSCNDVFSFIWIQGFCNMDISLSLCKWFPLKAVLEISALNWVKTVSVIGILLFPKALKFFSRRVNCGSRGSCLISTWFCGVMYCCLLSSFISWATQTGTHVRFHISFITADNFISWPVVDNSPLMSLRTLFSHCKFARTFKMNYHQIAAFYNCNSTGTWPFQFLRTFYVSLVLLLKQ